MFQHPSLIVLSICFAVAACSTPASTPMDAAVGTDAAFDTGGAADADAAGADATAGTDAAFDTGGAADADAAVGIDTALDTGDVAGADGAADDAPRADAGLRPSAVARLPCTADSECDDGIPCTLDSCEIVPGGRRCTYTARPAMCGATETCDIRMGCRPGRVCATAADCADTDPCTLEESCRPDSRTCVYGSVLDGDRDGFAPRACSGGDCDDSRAAVRPGEAETCNGTDDNCDGRNDEGTARDLCGDGASCTSASICVLDAPEDFADLARVCALEVACLGTLERLGVSLAAGERCAEALAGQLARTWVDGRLVVTQLTPGPGESRQYQEGRRSDPAPVREALRRARTATTCADYLGPLYARWARCRSREDYCDGNLLVDCRSGYLPSTTDCSALGGCVPGGFAPSCRTPATECSIAPRDHVRCDGNAIRVGCGEPIACPSGSRCMATVSEMSAGPTRVWQFQASCAPSANAVRLRCPDGSMVDAPVRSCPTGAAPPCTARGTCDGNRLTLCIDSRRTEFDCAALTGGACSSSMCMQGPRVVPEMDASVDPRPDVTSPIDLPSTDAMVLDGLASDSSSSSEVDARPYPPGPYGSRVCTRFAPFVLDRCDGRRWDFAAEGFSESSATVLYFASMWDLSSQREAAMIERSLATPYASRGVRVVQVLVQNESRMAILAADCDLWQRRYSLGIPVVRDPEQSLAPFYPALSFPAVVVVDGDARIRYRAFGAAMSLPLVVAALDDVLDSPMTCIP
jgi:hypothetical protein